MFVEGKTRTAFFPSDTLIYSISRDGSKNKNIRTSKHMILGQLRMGARQTNYAPLLTYFWVNTTISKSKPNAFGFYGYNWFLIRQLGPLRHSTTVIFCENAESWKSRFLEKLGSSIFSEHMDASGYAIIAMSAFDSVESVPILLWVYIWNVFLTDFVSPFPGRVLVHWRMSGDQLQCSSSGLAQYAANNISQDLPKKLHKCFSVLKKKKIISVGNLLTADKTYNHSGPIYSCIEQWTNGPMDQWTNGPMDQMDLLLWLLWYQLHWYRLSDLEWHL